jgi:hypothetical protein
MGALHSGHLADAIAPPHYKHAISILALRVQKRATDFRNYKGMSVRAVVEVSRVGWSVRLLLLLSANDNQQLTEPERLHNVCFFLQRYWRIAALGYEVLC